MDNFLLRAGDLIRGTEWILLMVTAGVNMALFHLGAQRDSNLWDMTAKPSAGGDVPV